jgi:metallo-beta-lactamase family protein
VGYQAAGTRGAALAAGAPTIKIHGDYVPVRASVVSLSSLSAHADYGEVLSWLRSIPDPPQRTFVTHGEPAAADAMRRHIEETYHWRCEVPLYAQTVELPGAVDYAGVDPCAAIANSPTDHSLPTPQIESDLPA